jgi:hypothetical protein
MPLSWNEIRDRSLAFSREWSDECSEDAEAKSFWDGFFNVFPTPPFTTSASSAPPCIEAAAQAVLDARGNFPTATLADLCDPLTMPPELVKAHQALDKAVDAAYGKAGFKSEAERVAFLFERYQHLAAPLVVGERAGKKKISAKLKP